MRWIIVLALMLLGYILGALLAVSVARADHRVDYCDARHGTLTWSASPLLEQGVAPWQFGQRDIVFGDTQQRQWLLQRPWGTPTDIYVLASDGDRLWVQGFCETGQSIIWVPRTATYEWVLEVASHEFLHAWRLGDHRWWSAATAAGYWSPARYCDGPQAHPYKGIMSYCTRVSHAWGPDDQAMLNRIWQ